MEKYTKKRPKAANSRQEPTLGGLQELRKLPGRHPVALEAVLVDVLSGCGSKNQIIPKWVALESGNMETKTCGLSLLFNFEPHPSERSVSKRTGKFGPELEILIPELRDLPQLGPGPRILLPEFRDLPQLLAKHV